MRRLLKLSVSIVLLLLCTFSLYGCGKKLNIEKNLDTKTVTVDDKDIDFKTMLYYIITIENSASTQANLYSDNPKDYWNIHVNGEFMSVLAKKKALNQAVYDEIYFNLAIENNISLTNDEYALLQSKARDFYNDMSDYQKELSEFDYNYVFNCISKSAMAEKYNDYIGYTYGYSNEQLGVEGSYYQDILSSHSYSVNNDIWDKISMGRVTLQ